MGLVPELALDWEVPALALVLALALDQARALGLVLILARLHRLVQTQALVVVVQALKQVHLLGLTLDLELGLDQVVQVLKQVHLLVLVLDQELGLDQVVIKKEDRPKAPHMGMVRNLN